MYDMYKRSDPPLFQYMAVYETVSLKLGLRTLLLEHGLSNHTSLDLASSSLRHDVGEENLLGKLEFGDTLGHP